MAGVKASTIFRNLEAADPAVKHRPDKGEIRKLLSQCGVAVAPGDNLQDAGDDAIADKVPLFIVGGATSYASTLNVPPGLDIRLVGRPTFAMSGFGAFFDFEGADGASMTGGGEITGTRPGWTYPAVGPVEPADIGDYTTYQSGIHVIDSSRIIIDGNIHLKNLDAGFLHEAPTLGFDDPGLRKFTGLSSEDCFWGARIFNFAEYAQYTQLSASKCTYGWYDQSGNAALSDSNFSFNNVGMRIDGDNTAGGGGGNNGHGSIIGVKANHCAFGAYFYKVSLGHDLDGCFFIADGLGGHGKIGLVDSVGINIRGGCIGADITVDTTSDLGLYDVLVRTDFSAVPAVAGAGKYYGHGNRGLAFVAGAPVAAGILGAPWNV
jgi:hypothetical protein